MGTMRRCYFDVREGDALQTEQVGRDLSSLMPRRKQPPGPWLNCLDAVAEHGLDRRRSIEVRDDGGPLLNVRCTFEIERP